MLPTAADGDNETPHNCDMNFAVEGSLNVASSPRTPPVSAPRERLGFLDLPKELRLMVYELMTVRVTHHTLQKHCQDESCCKNDEGQQFEFTLVTKSAPIFSIQATCRQINVEASSYLRPILNTILSEPPRIIMPYCSLKHLLCSSSPVAHLIQYAMRLRQVPALRFSEYANRLRSNPSMPYDISKSSCGIEPRRETILDPHFQSFAEKAARQLINYEPFSNDNRQKYFRPYWDTPVDLAARVVEVGVTLADFDICWNITPEQLTYYKTARYDGTLSKSDVIVCARRIKHAYDVAGTEVERLYHDWLAFHHINPLDPFWHSSESLRCTDGVDAEEWDKTWVDDSHSGVYKTVNTPVLTEWLRDLQEYLLYEEENIGCGFYV